MRLRASSSKFWTNCDLWKKGEEAAQRGTDLHEIASNILSGEYTQEIPYELEPYIEFIRNLNCDEYVVEHPITLDSGDSNYIITGTCDFAGIKDKTLHVVDLKTGFKSVPVDYNTQLLCYGMGMLQYYEGKKIDNVILTIVQQHKVKSFDYGLTLADFYKAFETNVVKALSNSIESPSECELDVCEYCPQRGECNRYQDKMHKEFAEFNRILNEQTSDFSDDHDYSEEWSELLSKALEIEVIIKQIKKTATDYIKNGGIIWGFDIVSKRSSRHWVGDETTISEMLKYLSIEPYTQSLKSPTDVEKEIGVKRFKTLGLTNIVKKIPYTPSLTDLSKN